MTIKLEILVGLLQWLLVGGQLEDKKFQGPRYHNLRKLQLLHCEREENSLTYKSHKT